MADAPASPPIHRESGAVIVFAIGPDFDHAETREMVERCRSNGAEPLVMDAASDPWFVDHLKDDRTREFFPLLCVGGGLVGPLAVVRQLDTQRKLRSLLLPDEATSPSPQVALSQAAAAVLRHALGETEQCIRVVVSANYEHELSVDTRQPGDLELSIADIPLLLDADSAARANGLAIDWVDDGAVRAFRIDNPNRPEAVRMVDNAWLVTEGARVDPLLIDARTAGEYARGHLDRAKLLDAVLLDSLEQLDRRVPLLFYCSGGVRSRKAAERCRELGFLEVYCLGEKPASL